MTTTLDLARVEHVRATPDVVLRNLRITQFYHDTATELRAHRPHDVSWFAFGTWASRTAGEFIRGEEVPNGAMTCSISTCRAISITSSGRSSGR